MSKDSHQATASWVYQVSSEESQPSAFPIRSDSCAGVLPGLSGTRRTKEEDDTDGSQKYLPPMHQALAEHLAVDIIEDRWEPGTSITLNDIQEGFGVSRTVAREAARTLEAARAVVIKRRVGLIAQSLDSWLAMDAQVMCWKLHSSLRQKQLLSLTELRLAVEPVAASNTALYAPMEMRALMPILARAMYTSAQAQDLAEFHRLDTRFHTEILTHSGNELFSSFSHFVKIVLSNSVEQGTYPPVPHMVEVDAHSEVAKAIREGDAEQAQSSMTRIVEKMRDAMRAAQ